MRFDLIVATALVVAGCRTPDEPASPPASSNVAVPSASAPRTPIVQTIHGGWFDVDLPLQWRELPLTTEKRRAMFAKQLNTPKDQPDVLVLIAQPRPLPESLTFDSPGVAMQIGQTLNVPYGLPPDAPTERGTLAGQPAVVVSAQTQKPSGEPAWFRVWGTVRDHQFLMLSCGGTGEGVAQAKRQCPGIVGTFRIGAPLVAPPMPKASDPNTFVVRKIENASFRTPADWPIATKDWLDADAVGGFRTERAADAGVASPAFETTIVQLATTPNVRDTAALVAGVDRIPLMKRVRRGSFKIEGKTATETELTDELGGAVLMYDIASKGTGYELRCSAPLRVIDVIRPTCQAIAHTLAVP